MTQYNNEFVKNYQITSFVVDQWIDAYILYVQEDPHADFADRLSIGRSDAKCLCYKTMYTIPALKYQLNMGREFQAERMENRLAKLLEDGGTLDEALRYAEEEAARCTYQTDQARKIFLNN